MSVDKVQALNIIRKVYGLQGEDAEKKLQSLSDEEVSKLISNYRQDLDMGVFLQHSDSVVMRDNHDKTVYTDDNGNEITELKDGDNVIERTIKSTDDKGNVLETTTTFSAGRPLTQIKSKNGNTTETTTFKYNDDTEIPYVTLETKKSDNSKVITNVLETDENGNFKGEDFIDRQTSSQDGTTTHIFTSNNCIVEQQEKPSGKKTATVYKGTDLAGYDNKQLKRLYQKTEQNGEVHEVAYDGKGNTLTTANAGDTLGKIAKRFNVSASQTQVLNSKIKNLKVLQQVVVPGEHDADSQGVKNTQDANTAWNEANQAEYEKQVAQKVSEGTDKKIAAELTNNGFKPTKENYLFYQKFNQLNPTQQQNVLSVIKYCKSQKITDPNKVKERILETFPEINLFDSGKTIPQSNNNIPAFQKKNPVSLETFLVDKLKLDLSSETGKMVYERLASLPQEQLNKINAQNFGDLSKANFVDIANSFESSGINIRTKTENQIEQNARVQRAERLGIPTQRAASAMLSDIYENAADMLEQYYHNHGVFDAGTYLEGYKNIIDWITPDKILGQDMRSTLHIASDLRKSAQNFRKMHTENPQQFKKEFKNLVGIEYNEANVKELMDIVQSNNADINSDKFKNACQKAFGFKGVENTESYIKNGEIAGNIGDIAVMLYTLGAASELKVMGKTTQGVFNTLEKGAGKFMGKTAAQKTAKVGTSMAMGGTTLGGFTAIKETGNNLSNSMRDAKSWETWKQTGIASAESFGFGAFGGLLNETVVAPIIKAIEKPAAKATQAVSKALTEQGELTGKQIIQTVSDSGTLKLDGLFKMNAQEWANLARSASAKGVGFGVEVGGFTAYEAALDVVKDIIDPKTGRLPENMTPDSLSSYLSDKFGEQLSNLGTIKGISTFLMMSKGGKVAQKAMMNDILSKSEVLKDIKFKKAEINGREVYEVIMPDGNRKVANSVEEVIANCNVLMQLDMISNAVKDNVNTEWRKIKIGDEEVEVAITKNADGVENVDFSKGRRLNANGEYEQFNLTTERDLLSSESDSYKDNFEIDSFENVINIKSYEKELMDAISKEKSTELNENYNYAISSILKKIKNVTPETRNDMINATKQLLANTRMRNGVVGDIIAACIEKDTQGYEKFNQQAFEKINKLFETHRENHPYMSDFEYSLRIAEIAKSATRFTKDENGQQIRIFDDTNFEIAKLYDKCSDRIVHIDFRYSLNDETGLIDLSTLPENFRTYILKNLPEDMVKNINKQPQEIFDRDKLENIVKSFGFIEKNGYLVSDEKLTQKINDIRSIAGGSTDVVLSKEDLDVMHKMINMGNHKEFWSKLDNAELITLYLRFKGLFTYQKPSIIESKGEKFWNKIIQNLEYNKPTEAERDALGDFVGDGYGYINKALTNLKDGKVANEYYMKEAENLAQLIDKHTIDEDIELTRVERNMERFSDIVLSDGTTLTKVLLNFDMYKDKLDEINSELSGKVIENERFMSATIRQEHPSMQGLSWEINLKKGSNAIFRNTYTDVNIHELEYIVQKDSKITIKGIKTDWNGRPVLITDVETKGTTESKNSQPSILSKLQTANGRESFVAIRDEINKLPNGEEKTQLMQEYLKKYNEWSSDPSRPDIRMQYMPERDGTEIPVANKTTTQTVSNKAFINIEDAKAKLQEFASEERDYTDMIIQRCSMNNQVSEVLLNEAISLLKSGVNSYDVSNIVYGFKVNDEAIDYNRIKKFHELVDKGTNAEDASHLLSYSTDKNGLYSEDLYNKIMSLNEQDYDASTVLDACKIDGEVVESTWQKALELNSLGFKNEDIENVLKSCRIKESEARTAKTIGFNDESYSKAKLLFEEHKFNPENISRIIERCTVDGKFSQECFDRAVSLHGKINESRIFDFVRYPNEILDFMLEIKDKYNIKEYELDYILRECVNTVDEKTVASTICMSKAEELITKYNIEADDVGHLLYASKVDGELDLKLYEEVIKMHQAGFNRIGSIIESLTTKGQNEGETSQVNYDLLQKTKEWKELGIEDDWISQYNRQFNELNIDVNKHDLVREYHNAEFKPNEIRDLLAANGNLENLSLTEFKDKVFELKKLGLDNNKIINLLNGIGMPNGWGNPKFKLSKQNLDMVIDMLQKGVKEPDRIVRASYDNYELNQDRLNTAYERIKDGISEDRLSCLNSMRHHFTEMPELEDVLINLSKTVREDYDYNSFYSLANTVYNEMYNSKSGKDVANNVIEALKKGAKEEDIKYILDTNFGDPVRINRDNLNKSEVISQIKTKLLNALVEHPESTEQIKGITNSVARAIVDGDLSELDFCLKYPDRYRDILKTEHPLDWNGNRRPELSNRARNLMLQFDSAGVPIDDALKYTDILCEHTSYLDEPIPENTLNKIIELRNNQKLDDNTLKMIRHLPFAEKTPELIDYVMDLKEKNLLPEFNEQNEYDIPVLVRILPNNSETGKLGLYENYKEILDFYVKNKDVLRYERVNGENHYITEFDDIVRNYKEHHSGIDKALDLEPFEAMAEIVRKTSISPETLNGIIGNGYADKLKAFTDKVDLEKYSNELNLIFSQLNKYHNHSSYSDILNENISKRDLEYLLDMQKLMSENVKENENPQILDNRWFRKFIGEKEIPAEALDKLRYYVEMELADPNKQGRYINIDRYHHTVRLYENSPENIERIESIMYNKGFEDGMYEHILSDLSSTPEVLNRQLDLIENILDYTGELSGHKSYLQSDLISILRDAKTLEDVNVKIELWEQLKSQLQSKSSIQKFWDANVKKQNNLGMALMCVEGTNATNKSAVLAAMANKKYSDLIWNCAGNIDKNNVALIEDIIKNDRLKNPDHANFAGIVVNTSRDEFKAKFVQENFDKIPQEDLQKATSILSEINGDLIIRLYNDKELNFPKEHILDIAPYCNQMNIDLVTRLCTDKNLKFPADQIKDIARALNLTNLELAEKLCTDKSLKCPPDKIVDILSAFQLINVDTKSLSLSQKINTLGTISSMDKTLLNLCRQYSPIDIDAKIAELTVSLGKKKDIINVSAAQQQMFVQNMMANNNQNTETVLKNFDFEQYGKQGLPLKYTREQFTANIENLIKDLSPEEQEVVLEHFGLIKGSAGFDGLPTNKPFNNEKVSSQVNEIAQKVQDEIETFTARNQINTGDATADNVLNGLIKGLPEFTSIVGKEQHGTHAYSVDIHTLKVLQSAMNNPLYEKLSDRDKTILKIAALCHDLGKRGGVVDTGHASSSAEYVTAILDKFPFPQGMKDRIIDIVDNHHWFEAYNTGSATAEDVAVRCRRPEDFMIYEILAKADFENVNKDFHISRSEGVTNQAEFDKFMQDKMEAIDEALTRMYSRANLVFDTQFMQNGEKFPRQTIEVDGEPTELKVLNLSDLKSNDSLQEYGFSTGVTKESARFTVHMTDPVIASMESVMILTQNSLNQSAWSTSLIKASNNRTYCNRKFGFVLDVDQANISEANYANTGSGCGKGLETFKRILFNANGSARTYVKDHLIKELSKKGVELNDNEYAQLSRFLVAKKYTTQITKNIKIGDKIINAKDLVECLEKSRDALFEGGDIHSEIVPINPRVKGLIAKVEKLEDCPEEFLEFAKSHNLPIILMKPTKE